MQSNPQKMSDFFILFHKIHPDGTASVPGRLEKGNLFLLAPRPLPEQNRRNIPYCGVRVLPGGFYSMDRLKDFPAEQKSRRRGGNFRPGNPSAPCGHGLCV